MPVALVVCLFWLAISVQCAVVGTVSSSVFSPTDVCTRWNRERSNMNPIVWSKSEYNCPVGRVNR